MKQSKFPAIGPLKDSIIKVMSNHNTSLNIKQIAWALDLKGSQYQKKIRSAVRQLVKEDLLIKNNNYKFQYNRPDNNVIGIIDINLSGHGYVSSKLYTEEIFIHKKNRLNSLIQDTVSVKLIKGRKGRPEGIVTKVISRKNTKFIGTVEYDGNNYFFIPDNSKIGSDFFIPTEHLKGANHNRRVIVEFIEWPQSTGCPFGRVTKVLDKKSTLKSEIESNIEVFNVRNYFSKNIDAELSLLKPKIQKRDLLNRKDFRKITTFTIDPDDAKDFDDAISVEFLKNSIIKIGVHIADVSHYVKPNSEIDKEAFARSFSVYFPGKVIPMLPEKLSNTICSLRPKEDKLSFSIVLEVSDFSQVKSIWMGKSIINSNKKFTYSEANDVLLTQEGIFAKELIALQKTADNLRTDRVKRGSIEFMRTDVVFELNKNGEPVSAHQKKPLKTHKLIEEFMLLANKIVANKLSNLKSCIYRVHDLPNKQKIQELSIYLQNTNPDLKIKTNTQKNDAKLINKLLEAAQKKLNNNAIESLILRSMSKAKYSIKNIGHFGLGFAKYTHFTSPIRRYSDLIIHRILNNYLNNHPVHLLDLEKKCVHFSNMEKTYLDIERKTTKFIQLKLLENKIGNTFSGFISGLTKWGMYISLKNGQGEGLVSINDLRDDKYYYNDNLHVFIGRRFGKKYHLGQEVEAQIKSINLYRCEMDLLILN